LNVEAGVFGALPQVPWSKIEENISRRSRSDAEESANLKVARGLFDYVQLQKLSGRRHDILPLSLGASTNLVFWHPVVLLIGGRPLVPFFDPRRAKALTFQARRFVFSVMHERIRAAHPDFAEVTLGIFQFAPSDDGPRAPILHTDEGVELFDFDELDLMVQDTYAMWREVCAVRTMESRRKAGGRGGGFI
jgi:hypothetical protein